MYLMFAMWFHQDYILNEPLPVALTTIVPVGMAQVGCVIVGAFTVGTDGTVAITTGFPLYTVTHVGLV